MNKIVEVILKDKYDNSSYEDFWSFISRIVDELNEDEYQKLMDIIKTII